MELIAECRSWWKLWSVRLAAIAGVLSGVIVAAWPVAHWLINSFIPDGPLRIVMGVALGTIVFAIPTLTRLLPQKKLKADG